MASATLHSGQMTSNVIAGLIIRSSRMYRKGDWIDTSGVVGKVTSLGLTHTTILKPVDRDSCVVENADVIDGTIINRSKIPGHPSVAHIAIYDYGHLSRSDALGVMHDSAMAFDKRMSDIDPLVYFDCVSGNAEYFKAIVHVKESYLEVLPKVNGDLTLDIIDALETKGVGIGEVGEVGFSTTELKVVSKTE